MPAAATPLLMPNEMRVLLSLPALTALNNAATADLTQQTGHSMPFAGRKGTHTTGIGCMNAIAPPQKSPSKELGELYATGMSHDWIVLPFSFAGEETLHSLTFSFKFPGPPERTKTMH